MKEQLREHEPYVDPDQTVFADGLIFSERDAQKENFQVLFQEGSSHIELNLRNSDQLYRRAWINPFSGRLSDKNYFYKLNS